MQQRKQIPCLTLNLVEANASGMCRVGKKGKKEATVPQELQKKTLRIPKGDF